MHPRENSIHPIAKANRVQLLDVLRGFAIFGIFIMNLWAFTLYFTYTEIQKSTLLLAAYDRITSFIQHLLFEGKFYSIFSLLFGIGFSIYLAKSSANNAILSLFKRRLLILFFIGFVHLLFWVGDIVAFYALLGFLLIPFRKLNDKKLLIISVTFIILPIPLYALKMWMPSVFNPGQYLITYSMQLDSAAGIKNEKDLVKVLSGGDFIKIVQANFRGILWRYGDLLFQDRIFKVFSMFLLGLVIGRNEFYKKFDQYKTILKRILIIGLLLGLPANYIMTLFMEKGGYYQLNKNGLYQTIAYTFGVAPLALAYVAGITLLYQNNHLRWLFNLLAAIGRMALTNYIMQSLIGLIFFTQLGFGISNMGPTAWTIFAVVVYIFQAIFSSMWLSYYNFGPLEWLWRSATYGSWQQMKKQPQ